MKQDLDGAYAELGARDNLSEEVASLNLEVETLRNELEKAEQAGKATMTEKWAAITRENKLKAAELETRKVEQKRLAGDLEKVGVETAKPRSEAERWKADNTQLRMQNLEANQSSPGKLRAELLQAKEEIKRLRDENLKAIAAIEQAKKRDSSQHDYKSRISLAMQASSNPTPASTQSVKTDLSGVSRELKLARNEIHTA